MGRLIWLIGKAERPRTESYLAARSLAAPLPSMRLLTRDVLADYDSRGGYRGFWLDEVIAHGGLGRIEKKDLFDHSDPWGWKVTLSCLKDPSIVSSDPFAPNAVLVITPKSFEPVPGGYTVVHPEKISVLMPRKKGLLSVVVKPEGQKKGGIVIVRGVLPCVRPARMDYCIRVEHAFDCGFVSYFAEPGVDADFWRIKGVPRNPAPTYDPFIV
jgi:hypothetical protein